MTKKRHGIDLDGTATNDGNLWLEYGLLFEKIKGIKSRLINPHADHVQKMFAWNNEFTQEFYNMFVQTIMQSAMPRIFLPQAVQSRIAQGDEIYFLTARFASEEIPDPMGVSKEWLRKYNVPYTALYVNCGNKVDICQELGIDTMTDNDMTNCDQLAAAGINTIIMDCPQNRDYINSKVERMYGWAQYDDKINKLLA